MPEDTFFSQDKCDRCRNPLPVRIMSFFTDETICTTCSEKEAILRNRIERVEGKGASKKYEGYGRIPTVEDPEDGDTEVQ